MGGGAAAIEQIVSQHDGAVGVAAKEIGPTPDFGVLKDEIAETPAEVVEMVPAVRRTREASEAEDAGRDGGVGMVRLYGEARGGRCAIEQECLFLDTLIPDKNDRR